ncbi:hypothetical protein N9045_00540 [bacterium]|nr:hypothetical protein [bacterium]
MSKPIWQYRAIDDNMNVVEGEIRADSFEQLVISLRQQHRLQILEATKCNSKNAAAVNCAIDKLEKRVASTPTNKPQYIIKSRPSMWVRFLAMFFR